MKGVIRGWGQILAGRQPNLSIEITRECPLTCPGCYAYGADLRIDLSVCVGGFHNADDALPVRRES